MRSGLRQEATQSVINSHIFPRHMTAKKSAVSPNYANCCKALMDFFKSRNESPRFVVLAPPRNAAALLLCSTYHSFLGVPIDGQTALRNETTNNAQVKTRLDGVEYIFLDEVSMVACDDNNKISSQLAKALN